MKQETAKRVAELMANKASLLQARAELKQRLARQNRGLCALEGLRLPFYNRESLAGAIQLDINKRLATIKKELDSIPG